MSADPYINKKDGYKYFIVMGQKDESTSNTIKDAYKAQEAARKVLEKSEEIVLVLNANGIKASKTNSDNDDRTFNSIYYLKDTVDFMIKE